MTPIKGKKFNGKIYGKLGHKSIYVDENKIDISDKEAEELDSFLEAHNEYNKKVNDIKNKYRW